MGEPGAVGGGWASRRSPLEIGGGDQAVRHGNPYRRSSGSSVARRALRILRFTACTVLSSVFGATPHSFGNVRVGGHLTVLALHQRAGERDQEVDLARREERVELDRAAVTWLRRWRAWRSPASGNS